MKLYVYEPNSPRGLGRGSGRREIETPLGRFGIIHWHLNDGECTEIRNESANWPELRLIGVVKPDDVLSLYLQKLIEFEGVSIVRELLAETYKRASQNGREEAQRQFRVALGMGIRVALGVEE